MDEVAVDLMGPWIEEINKRFNLDLTRKDASRNKLKELDSEGYNVYGIIREKGFFRDLKPVDGAVEYITKLHKDGHEIVFVTTPLPNSVYVYSEKLEWVEKTFPFIDLDNVIFSRRKDLIIGDVLLDDYIHNLKNFKGKRVFFNAMDSKQVEDIDYSVKSWKAFYKIVGELDSLTFEKLFS